MRLKTYLIIKLCIDKFNLRIKVPTLSCEFVGHRTISSFCLAFKPPFPIEIVRPLAFCPGVGLE